MQLAAYYSQARGAERPGRLYAGQICSDYSPGPAGHASPRLYQTAVVTPDAALCEALKEKN